MRSYHDKSRTGSRSAAAAMALFILVSVLFAAAFLAAEADHDCQGDHCPVCAVMEACENTIRTIGTTVLPVLAVFFVAAYGLQLVQHVISFVQVQTPVSRKIRINC